MVNVNEAKKVKNWREIKAKKEFVTFRDKNINTMKFLNDGEMEIKTIVDKNTNKEKEIATLVFDVMDVSDSREKKFSTSSSRLIEQLGEYDNLKGYTLQLTGIGSGFNRRYEILEISKPKIKTK